jgi:hypothetical protein
MEMDAKEMAWWACSLVAGRSSRSGIRPVAVLSTLLAVKLFTDSFGETFVVLDLVLL